VALPLLARLVRQGDPGDARALTLHRLLRTSVALHRDWIVEAGAETLLRASGWLKLFRTPEAAAGFAPDLDLLRRAGTRHRLLDAADLRALEPALAPGCTGGVLLEDACSLSSPRALSERYMEHLRRLGGRFAQLAVTGLRPDGDGWQVLHGGGRIAARRVVVAAGPWSADLLAPLGLRLPLFVERGYHLHLAPGSGPGLRRPVHDIAGGYVMTPQSAGIRVTSGVEIAPRDAPPHEGQIRRAAAAARALAGLGPAVEARPWLGCRPSLPDGLPAIGPVPGRPGLWLNTGHNHVGLSLAAGSGDLLARLMAGTAAASDAAPFDPGRLWPVALRTA
jgi:D-amino-acid dehydrogenase